MMLVTGATGTIGSHLLPLLAADGGRVRALAHSAASRERIAGHGLEAVDGDFDRPETLAAALQGCDTLFLLSPPHPDMAEREKRAVDLAGQAGVGRVVALSAIGAQAGSPNLPQHWHADIDEHLRASGLEYTILRPSGFMQVHTFPVPTVSAEGVWYGMSGDGAVAFIDARDVADVAARALTERGHAGATYELTGPQAVSMPEAAAQLADVLGREVRYVDLPAEQFRAALIGMGVAEWLADSLVAFYRTARDGHAATVSNEVGNILGRAPRSFRQFAEDHKAAFAAA